MTSVTVPTGTDGGSDGRSRGGTMTSGIACADPDGGARPSPVMG